MPKGTASGLLLIEVDNIMKSLSKGRLDAFADGVFAIVITLLVLDLPIPEASEDFTALMPLWPDFFAYIISFAFIGSFWLAHSSITYLTKQETPPFVPIYSFNAVLRVAASIHYEVHGYSHRWPLSSFPGNNLRVRSTGSIGYDEHDHTFSSQHSRYPRR
jgi:hypothetical protein